MLAINIINYFVLGILSKIKFIPGNPQIIAIKNNETNRIISKLIQVNSSRTTFNIGNEK